MSVKFHTNWLWIFWLQVVDKPATTTLASTSSCIYQAFNQFSDMLTRLEYTIQEFDAEVSLVPAG